MRPKDYVFSEETKRRMSLCENQIPFGKDELDHKIPLSRGGNNLYENLGIVCRQCNSKKRSKTFEEYLEVSHL